MGEQLCDPKKKTRKGNQKMDLEVSKAAESIAGRHGIRETPLEPAFWLNERGNSVFVKLENQQVTGSFKARGAMNKVMNLPNEDLAKGLVTASTGNHAMAVVHAVKRVREERGLDVSLEVFVPKNASSAKVDLLRAWGAPLRFEGDDCLVAEQTAKEEAKKLGKIYISPYNDVKVLAGQGTIAYELLRQNHSFDAVFVSVGGGGLISGIAAYLKAHSPCTKIVGCSAKNDAHMAKSVRANTYVDVDSYLENGPTISEGTAGAFEEGSVTYDICCDLVDEWIDVSEEEIGQSVVDMLDKHHQAIEGAAGVAIAGYKRKCLQDPSFTNKTCAIIICGGNVKATLIRDLLNQYLAKEKQ